MQAKLYCVKRTGYRQFETVKGLAEKVNVPAVWVAVVARLKVTVVLEMV